MANNDDLYNFNAPKHFIDFSEVEDIEVDESYFDCPSAEEIQNPSKEQEQQQTDQLQEQELKEEGQQQEELEPEGEQQEELEPEGEQQEELEQEGQQQEELVQEGQQQEEPEQGQEEADQQHQHDMEDSPEERRTRAEKKKSMKSMKRHTSDVAAVGVRHSPRLAAISKALRRSSARRHSLSMSQITSSSTSLNRSRVSRVAKPLTQHKSDIAKLPRMQGLSQEDVDQLETIATFKRKMAENKKKDSVSNRPRPTKPREFHFATDSRLRQKAPEEMQQEPEPHPKIRQHGPTKPQEFHFATDTRVKSSKPKSDEEHMDFTQSLRSSTTSLNKDCCKGPTRPQPFNLTTSRKGKVDEAKFVSMAELNLKFHTKTPQRFRSKRAGSVEAESEKKKSRGNSNPVGVTIPHTPNLTTRSRSRNLNYLTHEEKEQQEFEEAQRNAFKAHPVNKKVLEPPSTGYQVEKKHVTPLEPFNITDSKKTRPPPLNPNYQNDGERINMSSSSLASLHAGIPVKIKWDKTSTKVQPFSFDSSDKNRFQQKQEKIKKMVEEEKKLAEFHANPMPVFEDGVSGVPPKKPPTPTRAKPFNLHSDERGVLKQEQLKKKLEEEKHLDSERRKFTAQPDDVVHKDPFLPKKSNKPLTDISGFTLNTEQRAEERHMYELHRKMKEDEIQAAKREQEERQAAEEEAEIARLRLETIHKANPVRKYKPLVLQPSSQPPTAPKSPKFLTETRIKSRLTRSNTSLNISSATFTAE